MSNRVSIGNLLIAQELHDLVADEIAPGTGVDPQHFWKAFETIVTDLAPKNRALLDRRDELQAKLDAWHREHRDDFDFASYKDFLVDIGYLLPEGDDFCVETRNVDPEIATVAGPQLVVPVNNARYALNAANARWGSLYDALYGTDVIPESDGLGKGKSLNMQRAEKVIELAAGFLDEALPLAAGSHAEVVAYRLADGNGRKELVVTLAGGDRSSLAEPAAFVGYTGNADTPDAILLCNNGLHIEIQIDREHPVGATDGAGVKDVVLEGDLDGGQMLVELPGTVSDWFGESLSTRRRLQEENDSLRTQQFMQQAQLLKLAALEAENIRLRELLDSSFEVGEKRLIAELMSVNLDPYKHQIVINKGELDDIYPGQPLLDATGVMGQIVHAGPYTSTAVLITDPSHAIPVQVNRTGLRTIALGTGSIELLPANISTSETWLTVLPAAVDGNGLGHTDSVGQVGHPAQQPHSHLTIKFDRGTPGGQVGHE